MCMFCCALPLAPWCFLHGLCLNSWDSGLTLLHKQHFYHFFFFPVPNSDPGLNSKKISGREARETWVRTPANPDLSLKFFENIQCPNVFSGASNIFLVQTRTCLHLWASVRVTTHCGFSLRCTLHGCIRGHLFGKLTWPLKGLFLLSRFKNWINVTSALSCRQGVGWKVMAARDYFSN